MSKQNFSSSKILFLTVVLAPALSVPRAHAQSEAQPKELLTIQVTGNPLEYRQFERVEITGSSIIRKEQTQALPVQIVTRADLRKSGITTLTNAVQSLHNVFNGLDLSQAGMNQGAYTSAALHGMPTGTLVLVNGKRLAPYGIQNVSGQERASVDLGLIPLSAVERIEVLSDGASSLYGTDAIAGVINIITRTEFNGTEVSVNRLQPKGGVGQNTLATLNWGKGLLSRDGYSIRISAEADHVDSVPTASRPTVARARVGFTHAGQNYEADSLKASAFTSPAWLYSPNTARNAFSSLYENGACVGTNVSYRGLNVACRQNQLPGFDIYPESSSQKLHALGELWLNNEATLYAEFLYGRQQEQIGINSWPAQSGRITNTPGSVGYAEMAANGMDTSYGFYYWQPNLTALRQRFEKSQMRSVMGVKGEWDNWNYNANVYHAVSKTEQNNELADYASLGITTTGLSNPLRDQRLLQPLDAQNSLTGQLLDSRYWERQATGQVTFSAAELRASKAIYELDGKDVLFGWGLEVRNEKVNSDFNSKLVTPSFQGQRRNTAAYAELQIPVRSNWDVITSLRNDRYSDVGNTTNGKLATRWAINEAWAIRGGVGTGFRAPTIGQVQVVPENFALTTAALGACSAAMEGVISRLVSPDGMTVECPRNSNIRIFSNGNQDLRPEKSVQATLGLAMAPTRNLNVAVDYWRVQMRDTLQFESANAVLENPEKYASSYIVDPKVYLQNFGAIKIHYSGLLLKMKNLGESFKEGLDLDVRYRIPLDDARLTLGAQATYVMNSKERLSPDAEWISDLAKYSAGTDQVTPRVRGRITVALEKEGIGWQLNANYSSGYIDKDVRAFNIETGKTGNVTGRRVPSLTTWDFFGTYQVNRALQWRYGIVNLFDRQPPLSFYSVTNAVWGANSQYGSLMGRTLNVGMTYRF